MMRRQDYRRAVGNIRWSPEKRAEIEEKLRSAPDTAFSDATDGQSGTQWEETRKEWENIQMKEKRMHKMYLLILAAAMLAIGGTVAAVAHYGKNKLDGGESTAENSEAPEKKKDSIEDSISNVSALIFPELTNQQDDYNMHGLAQTENGIFFLGNEQYADADSYVSGRALRYFDKASAQTDYVCAKQNCPHDSNGLCTATSQNYSFCSDPVWLNGYVYIAAMNRKELLENPEGCDKFPLVLLRIAPDGSESTEMTALCVSEEQYTPRVEMIAHRGQLWINCYIERYKQTSDDTPVTSDSERFSGYAFYCYEPKPAKLTKLLGMDELIKDFTWESIKNLRGSGDYIYFLKETDDWRDPVKGKGIFRLDCRNGATEQVVSTGNIGSISAYDIGGGNLFYLEYPNYDSFNPSYKALDLQTGKTRDMKTFQDLVQTQYPDFDIEEAAKKREFRAYLWNLTTDDSHVFIIWDFDAEDTDSDSENAECRYLSVLSLDGEIEQTVRFPKKGNIFDADILEQQIRFLEKHSTLTDAEIEEVREHGIEDRLETETMSGSGSNICFDSKTGKFWLHCYISEATLSLDELLNGTGTYQHQYYHTVLR